MKYDVFISYSRKDSSVADRICEAFDKVGITYFIDRQGISGGFEFSTVIAEAIKNSCIFLFLASKNSYDAKFTMCEVMFAFNKMPKESLNLYIIDDSTLPDNLYLLFSAINWRRLDEHPIETVLVDDLFDKLGKKNVKVPESNIILPSVIHKKVDLGLSVYWADCNVGANSPEEYGNYFAWGETMPKDTYTIDNSKIWKKDIRYILGISEYDAATANWGAGWRMPTEMEFKELIDKCAWQWTEQGGKKGYKVISNKNGNSIFLPAAGYRYGLSLSSVGEFGRYWSTTSRNRKYDASCLNFYIGYYNLNWYYRNHGHSVRPVSK